MKHFALPAFCFLALAALLLTTHLLTADDAPKPPPAPLPTTIFKNLQAGKPQTVVVYGTSLTHGGAWAVALREWFDQQFPKQVKFVNSGGPGQNSDWGVQNLDKLVLAHHPDLVFIEFSYNDAHLKFNMPVETGAQNLDKIVQALRGQNPQMDIVLQTMNVPWDAPNGTKSLSNRPQLETFNDNYRRYAQAHQLPLLDHYPNWLKFQAENPEKYKAWLPDGNHPNKEASLAITWPAIKALLERAQQAAGPTAGAGK